LTSNFRILVCDDIDNEGVQKLRKAGFTVDIKHQINHEELTACVGNYDALIVRGRTKVTKEVIEAGLKLRVIGRAGVGLDNIDTEAAQQRGLTILNTPEATAQAAAELTLGLILSILRNIAQADCAMKDKKWTKNELIGRELKGKTLGVIGLGNIGERVARLGRAFGMRILVHKRTFPDPALMKELEAEFVPLHNLLANSDVVTIHVPYTPQTHHMIGERELSLMRNGAYLVNTSRGAIVEQEALLKALKSGKLGGAALDVYETEPPVDWTLMRLPSIVCTPHIGAQTAEAQKAASVLLAEKIISAFS
jgi:D-3-phosphoglycerate dehydrogenase